MSGAPASPTPRGMVAHFARGLAMGTADSIPGVSGGTVALVVGIYERLLASIGSGFRAILALARLNGAEALANLRRVEWALVIPLLAGIVSALVVAAEVVPSLLADRPAETRALFLGMVLASVAVPLRRIGRMTGRLLGLATLSAAVAFALSGIPPGSVADPSPLQVVGAAAVAICAMILPGVSGAFLLLVLGMYEPTLDALERRDLAYVALFVAGAVAGLGTFSLLLTALLRRHHDATMTVLVGLMVGSLRALWPWQEADRALEPPPGPGPLAVVVLLVVIGSGLVLLLDRTAARRPVPAGGGD